MKNLKKIVLGTGTIVLGVTLLVGCSNNTKSETEKSSTQTATSSEQNDGKKEEKSNSSYDTTGLTEKNADNVKFYTSVSNWETKKVQDYTMVMTIDSKTGSNLSVFADKTATIVGIDKWSEITEEKLEKMLQSTEMQDLTVQKTNVNGKETFKVSYTAKTLKGTQYYINLDGTHVAAVTYTQNGPEDSYAKETENIINTIEYIK